MIRHAQSVHDAIRQTTGVYVYGVPDGRRRSPAQPGECGARGTRARRHARHPRLATEV